MPIHNSKEIKNLSVVAGGKLSGPSKYHSPTWWSTYEAFLTLVVPYASDSLWSFFTLNGLVKLSWYRFLETMPLFHADSESASS